MNFKWYTIAVAPGRENKIYEELEKLSEAEESIKEVFLPVVKKKKAGEDKEQLIPMYSGYIFLCCDYNSKLYLQLRKISGVSKFLENRSDKTPAEMSQLEIDKIKRDSEAESNKVQNTFEVGKTVKINEGNFETFTGEIVKVDDKMLEISISIFGRPTNISIEPFKVELLEN